MKNIFIGVCALISTSLISHTSYATPYSDEYLADKNIPAQYRLPSLKNSQWKVVEVRKKFARFVDSDSIFISDNKVYFNQVTRILSEAGIAPFSDHLPVGTAFGSEFGGRIEIDCALAKKNPIRFYFADYYLGGRGQYIEGKSTAEMADSLDISIFCTSNRDETLRTLDALDKQNRGKVSSSLYGRYDR